MKTILLAVLISLNAVALLAQTSATPAWAKVPARFQRASFATNAFTTLKQGLTNFLTISATALSGRTLVSSRVAERGPHHKVVQSVTAQTNLNGQSFYRTNSYTELATGMHYWENGEWKETRELIEPFETGAVARFGPHKVAFANNLNTAGAIDMQTPDGKRLRSHVLGLAYFDTASGQTVLIAEIKDCQGQIVGSNQVVYADAFTADGDARLDVCYKYTKAGFEQDVIARTQLPSAQVYGLNPATAVLQVISEFLEPPSPAKVEQTATTSRGETVTDTLLDFGEFKMTAGRAFAIGQRDSANTIAVAKRWRRVENRDLLFEEVFVSEIARELEALPKGAALNKPGKAERTAKLELQLPHNRNAIAKRGKMLVAKLDAPKPGFVLDWITLGGQTAYTLQGDTTYFVSGYVALYGTNFFEGGAVIKFAPNASLNVTPSYIPGAAVFKTSPYRPVVFTAQDDDLVGERLDGISTHDPTGMFYGNPALNLAGLYPQNTGITNVHFRYAKQAIGLNGNPATIMHAQFVNCEAGIRLAGSTATVRNALFANVATNFFSTGGGIVVAQHVTIDNSLHLAAAPANPNGSSVAMTNCVLANITNSPVGTLSVNGSHNGFYQSPEFGVSLIPPGASSPFQTSGGGSHYLAGDEFRAQGTTPIDASLLAALKAKTTHPPIAFPRFMLVTGELTLFPQVARYVSGPPDLGYYYDVMDYSVAAMLLDRGRLNVQPGTVVGYRVEESPEPWWPYFWTLIGFDVTEGAVLVSHGTPNNPNTFTDSQTIQENPQLPAIAGFHPDFLPNGDNLPPPVLDFRFSRFSVMAQFGYHFWSGKSEQGFNFITSLDSAVELSFRDCAVFGGKINIGRVLDYIYADGAISWTNNLFDRTRVYLDPNQPGNPEVFINLSFRAFNNLFRGGLLKLAPFSGSETWLLKDNLFDKVAFEQNATQPLDHNYNGYWKRLTSELEVWQTDRLTANDTDGSVDAVNDKVLLYAVDYKESVFGDYYLPQISPLYNAGSRLPGEAGLYHYTSRTTQLKDGQETGSPNKVNIGLHYVATASSTSTQPKDSETPTPDGIPDYVEDQNGDGVVDANETNPSLVQTQTSPPIADSLNSIYDDIDLDGDGMVGRIERALARNALVWDNPLLVVEKIEEQPGIFGFKVPINHSFLTSIGSMHLNVDGAAATLDDLVVAGDGKCLLRWNTTFDAPGQRLLQPQLGLLNPALDVGIFSMHGPILPFYSDNVLTFSLAGSMFDEAGAFLDAELPTWNATYTIDLYDPSTVPPTLIKTIGPNTTSSGAIQEDWNVTYEDNTAFGGNTVQAAFTVTLLDDLGAPIATGTGKKILRRPPGALTEWSTKFNFAYMYVPKDGGALATSFDRGGTVWNGMQSVVDALIAPRWPWQVYESYFNGYAPPTSAEYPGFLKSQSDVTGPLFNTLGAARQFYCNAHGDSEGRGLINGLNNVVFGCQQISDLLGNRFDVEGGMQSWNPYRFVFLDSCYSAATDRWPEVFGIAPTVTGRSRVGPQAFVGWQGQQSNPLAGTVNGQQDPLAIQDYTETLQAFYVYWMSGQPLKNCIDWASDETFFDSPLPVSKDGKEIRILTVGNEIRIWRLSKIFVVGHSGLTVSGLNPSYDGYYLAPYQRF